MIIEDNIQVIEESIGCYIYDVVYQWNGQYVSTNKRFEFYEEILN